jgi:hypothetical protein
MITWSSKMSDWVRSMKPNQPGKSPTWEDDMTTAPHRVTPAVEVGVMSAAEWKSAVQRALAELKLTYDQLAEQARTRNFSSVEAMKLWVAIGGKRPSE